MDPSDSPNAAINSDEEELIPTQLSVRSSDDKIFVIEEYLARQSSVIMEMLEYSSLNKNNDIKVALSSNPIQNLIKFAEFFKNEEPYEPSKSYSDFKRLPTIHPSMLWLKKQCIADIKDLISAIAFFDIPRLTDYLLNNVLQRMVGKDTNELRQEFGYTLDFTAETEEKIRSGHEII